MAALTDLIAGQAQVMFPATVSSIEHIRDGRLRAPASHHRDALRTVAGHPGQFVPGYRNGPADPAAAGVLR